MDDPHFYLMDRIMKEVKSLTKDLFGKEGVEITVDQWTILKAIAEREGSSQQEISEMTLREPAAITRMLCHLRRFGLVVRSVDRDDKRKQLLYLSDEGWAMYEKVFPIVAGLRQRSLNRFTKDDRHNLCLHLQTMLEAIYDHP